MKNIWMWVIIILIIVGGAWYYERSKTVVPAMPSDSQTGTQSATTTDLGTYSYECDEHVTFTMTPASDMSTVSIAPSDASSSYPTAATLSQVATSSGVEYQGSGYTFTGKGESVTLTSNGSTLNCSPVQNPDMAPFNFGD